MKRTSHNESGARERQTSHGTFRDDLRRLSHCLWIILSALLMAALYYYLSVDAEWSLTTVTFLALGVTATSGLTIYSSGVLRLFGFVGIFFAYLSLAHMGVVGIGHWGEELLNERYNRYQLEWYYSALFPKSVVLSGLGIGAFVLGATVVSELRGRMVQQNPLDQEGSVGVYLVGLGLLGIAAFYIVFIIVTGIIPLFASYMEYRQIRADLPGFAWFLWALATGLVFLFAAGNRYQRRIGIIIFACSAVLLMTHGSRGEVLFPIAAGLAVLTTRGYRVSPQMLLAGMGVFFLLIPFIAEMREVGLAEVTTADIAVAPADAPLEIGFTQRTVVNTMAWIDGGESHTCGETYLRPVLRQLGRFVPGYSRPPIKGTRYLPSDRLPTQGYSVVAEAYYNFGDKGVIALLFLIGLLVAFIGEGARNSYMLAFSGALFAALVNHVRNGFVFVPGHVVATLIALTVAVVLTHVLQDLRRRRDRARAR